MFNHETHRNLPALRKRLRTSGKAEVCSRCFLSYNYREACSRYVQVELTIVQHLCMLACLSILQYGAFTPCSDRYVFAAPKATQGRTREKCVSLLNRQCRQAPTETCFGFLRSIYSTCCMVSCKCTPHLAMHMNIAEVMLQTLQCRVEGQTCNAKLLCNECSAELQGCFAVQKYSTACRVAVQLRSEGFCTAMQYCCLLQLYSNCT